MLLFSNSAPLFLLLSNGAEEKARPVIDIDGTVLIQFTIFLLMYFVLRRFVFGPYLEMRKLRSAGIEGVQAKAGEMDQKARDLGEEYERRIRAARGRAEEERGRLRGQGLDREREVLDEVRGTMQKQQQAARVQIQAQTDAAGAELQRQAQPLARQIARKILGREVMMLAVCLGLCGALLSSAPDKAWAQAPAGEHETTAEPMGAPEDEGPVIENWWSWDYGAGQTHAHKHPPFGFAIINFLVFLFVLYRLAGGSFREFLRNRHHQVKRALDEAREVQQRAQKELDRYQERIRGIDAEVESLLHTVRREAEAERGRIIAQAQVQAEQLRLDAEAQIRQEIERARHDLEKATARAAIAAAEAILRSQVQDADQKRLVDGYVASMETLAQPASAQKRFPS